jgi:hypothetical protein
VAVLFDVLNSNVLFFNILTKALVMMHLLDEEDVRLVCTGNLLETECLWSLLRDILLFFKTGTAEQESQRRTPAVVFAVSSILRQL